MNEIKIFSPATVANVACGYDVLGFCLDTIGDEMVIRKTKEKGIITFVPLANYSVGSHVLEIDLDIDHSKKDSYESMYQITYDHDMYAYIPFWKDE